MVIQPLTNVGILVKGEGLTGKADAAGYMWTKATDVRYSHG